VLILDELAYGLDPQGMQAILVPVVYVEGFVLFSILLFLKRDVMPTLGNRVSLKHVMKSATCIGNSFHETRVGETIAPKRCAASFQAVC
jgi:hypothetical protein